MSLRHLLTANVNYANEPHKYHLMTIIKHEPQYVSTRWTTDRRQKSTGIRGLHRPTFSAWPVLVRAWPGP